MHLGYTSCSSLQKSTALLIHTLDLHWAFLRQFRRLGEIAFRSRPALACGELLFLEFKSLQTEDYGDGKYWVGLGIVVLTAEGSMAFHFRR